MTSCATGVCGTGGWTGPLPGDPDTSVSAIALTATPAFGGIDVNWTYPAVNPEAVAHTLLYRGDTADFNGAIQRAVVAGNFFYDKVESGSLLYYWIRIVSVNGTLGDLIGPASARTVPLAESMMEKLTGQIDAGVLAQSLKAQLDQIVLVQSDLQSEITAREDGSVSLAQSIQQAQDGVAQALTFIDTETQTRNTQDSLLADQLTAVAVTAGDNLAAVQQDLQTKITTVDGRVDTVASQVDQVAAQDAQNLAVAQSTLNASISAVDGRVSALSSHVDAVQTQAAGDLAAAQVTLQTHIDTVDGKATAAGATYTARLTVGGLIGGFGVLNDGSFVTAGFDVDSFWIGRTGPDMRRPFIVSDGVVYINTAVIPNASIGNAQIGNFLGSSTFDGALDATGHILTYGTTGWAIDKGGKAVFNDVVIRKVTDIISRQSVPSVASISWQGDFADTGTPVDDGGGGTTYIAYPDGGWNPSLRMYGANRHNMPFNQRVRYAPADSTNPYPVTFNVSINAIVDDAMSLWYRLNGGTWVLLWATVTAGSGDSFGTINLSLSSSSFPGGSFGADDYIDFGATGTKTNPLTPGNGVANAMFTNQTKRYMNLVNFTVNCVNV